VETDRDRFVATNFTAFCNSNVSFFIGVDAAETNATMLMAGDHNITNGTPVRNGILSLTANRESGWTAEVHNKCGYIAMADGSVQEYGNSNLQFAVASAGVATNRLQMPILSNGP
jgi:DhnA family fructose-bisphosphate aldolase class Ia